jgi:hypothetical protein
MTTTFRLRLEPVIGHQVHVTVFVGEKGTLVYAGEIVLDVGQWQLLSTALSLGAAEVNRSWPFVSVEVENEAQTLARIGFQKADKVR